MWGLVISDEKITKQDHTQLFIYDSLGSTHVIILYNWLNNSQVFSTQMELKEE